MSTRSQKFTDGSRPGGGRVTLVGAGPGDPELLGPGAIALGATSSELYRFGFGAVQNVDAASMSLWIKYREMRADVAGVGAAGSLDDFRSVTTGVLMNF